MPFVDQVNGSHNSFTPQKLRYIQVNIRDRATSNICRFFLSATPICLDMKSMRNALLTQECTKHFVNIFSAIINSNNLNLYIELILYKSIEVSKTLEHFILVTHEINPSHARITINKGHKILHATHRHYWTCPYI